MTTSDSASVILCTADLAAGAARASLKTAGFDVALGTLDGEPINGTPIKLVLIDGASQTADALELCRRVRRKTIDSYVPVLFLAAPSDGAARRAGLEAGADASLTWPDDAQILISQAHALLRVKERHDALAAKAAEAQRLNHRLQAAYQQIDQELELAQRLQECFLPPSLPQLPKARFAVQYKPCGRVGGDFYDVFRLDEQHLGLYVADAMGHGVPASLLTIFVKTGVRAKEINGQSYRLVPPDEVLDKLNHDMIGQALAESPFVTMVYGLFNHHTGKLQLSRAGHPYPIHVPREGPPALLQMEGSLLGVFDTRYHLQEHQLNPGDKLLVYTDGMDAAAFAEKPVGVASLLAAADAHRRLPVDELVRRLSSELFHQTRQTDDLTVLGLEIPR
jgi:sigma-B regulation protein RsbU (phosphoserine phosphatase)